MNRPPSEIVGHLDEAGPAREVAARELMALLGRLATAPIRGGRTIDPPDRDEIVQRVLFKVIDRAVARRLTGRSDGECESYFRAMLSSAWIDELRIRRRERPAASDDVAVGQAAPPAEDPIPLDAAHALLDRAFLRLRDQRRPRYRAEADRAWTQVQDLVFEGVGMDAILSRDEAIGAASDKSALKQARDRVLQSHKRLRDGLASAIGGLAGDGAFDAEEAELARAALRMLLRCQRPVAASSSAQEKP